ncbi:MAG TPA: kynureninase, partial [Actinomycetes bacterium]|nr:kynureninase [Actinomycetes bacterium]
MAVTDRADAERLDRDDPLADLRDQFVIDDPDLLYLDGNSLGRLPRRSIERLRTVVEREWGERLIRSWNERWMDLPMRAGDRIGEALVGAAPGQVAVSDSTSVNLYKLAVAALDARSGRDRIVSDRHNFPSDRYVLEGLAAARGCRLELVEFDELGGPTAAAVGRVVDERTALVSLSQVDYRSGALADMAAINAVAHRAGALTLWDLCHSVGAVPVELDADGTDLAVGCTYKYLNAGPGAPAFLYVRQEHQASLRQPIWGWFGQRDQFAMAQGYDPAPDLSRFLVGTPFVPGIALVEEGVALLAEAGIERLRVKGVALTELAIELHEAGLASLGFTLASPRDPARRGAHVSLAHPDGYRICQALISKARVIPDFRPPDRIRIGP